MKEEDKSYRVVFTGAHGTGKTTVLKMLESEGYNTISGFSRQLREELGQPTELVDKILFQTELYKRYREVLISKETYISDRSLICVDAYTNMILLENEIILDRDSEDMLTQKLSELSIQMGTLTTLFHFQEKDVKIVYFPIEFALEDDGVRPIEPEFQRKIDRWIFDYLSFMNLPFLTVYGSPEERLAQIKQYII